MAIIARIVAPGYPHHIIQRGNRIFYKITKEDYEKGLKDLEALVDLPNIMFI